MSAWRHGADVARVEVGHRRAVMNLERLDQPPVVLEGAALLIHDLIDGERDSDAIVAELSDSYPQIPDLASQVYVCLEQLANLGIIRR